MMDPYISEHNPAMWTHCPPPKRLPLQPDGDWWLSQRSSSTATWMYHGMTKHHLSRLIIIHQYQHTSTYQPSPPILLFWLMNGDKVIFIRFNHQYPSSNPKPSLDQLWEHRWCNDPSCRRGLPSRSPGPNDQCRTAISNDNPSNIWFQHVSTSN